MQGQGLLVVIDALGMELDNLRRMLEELRQENARLMASQAKSTDDAAANER